jgi:hypothetical protein
MFATSIRTLCFHRTAPAASCDAGTTTNGDEQYLNIDDETNGPNVAMSAALFGGGDEETVELRFERPGPRASEPDGSGR